MSEKITAMIEEIKGLTVLELSELVHALEEEFGVSAAAMAAPAAGAAAPAAEEKTDFDVILTGFDAAQKIKVIKVIREVMGLGLAEAKAAVEGAPTTMKEGLSKEDAEALKKQVEEVGGKDIPFSAVTVEWLQKCERLWSKTRSISTIGMHMRNIRTLMNEAKRAGVIKESQYPFGKGLFEIKTGIGRKKGLTKKQLKAIFDYKSGNETTNRYKDLWIFIYLCNGINPTDMLKLKFSDIVDGEICFVRQKTERTTKNRKEIRATISVQMQAVIDKWGNKPLPDNYIFPYMKGNETAIEAKAITRDVVKRINKRMKLIGEELGIGNITTYTARHSYATVLKRSGVNISYISESLGHTD